MTVDTVQLDHAALGGARTSVELAPQRDPR
jgi:hypothetical protein